LRLTFRYRCQQQIKQAPYAWVHTVARSVFKPDRFIKMATNFTLGERIQLAFMSQDSLSWQCQTGSILKYDVEAKLACSQWLI